MSDEPLPEPAQRLMRFAGKKRNEVSNPCLTAREAIVVADYIAHAAAVSAAENAALRERAAALEQDAARYRWLRAQGGWVSYSSAEMTDAAIDAALKEQK